MFTFRTVAAYVSSLALTLCLAACGSSDDDSRPIEVIFYVDALSGTRFAVDGLQARNGDHHLPDRTFQTPFFFVMENALQFKDGPGIRGCFRTFADEPAPVTVYLYFGTTFQELAVLQPGECYATGGTPVPCDQFGSPCADTDDIVMREPEVRFEICTHTADTLCVDSPDIGPANVSFSSSIGDFDATNITTCSITEAAVSSCTTPSIFYLEDPRDRVQGIFQKLSGQNDDVDLQTDLYIGDDLRTSKTDSGDIIIDEGL